MRLFYILLKTILRNFKMLHKMKVQNKKICNSSVLNEEITIYFILFPLNLILNRVCIKKSKTCKIRIYLFHTPQVLKFILYLYLK